MEYSESGAPIYRHQEESEFELAMGDSENIEKISAHIEQHIGPVATVFHELISDQVHIDVHIVEPSANRPFYSLITSGMSDKPMTVPPGAEALRFAELMICLPPEWPMGDENWKDQNNYWPIYVLKFLARFPHQYKTWLWASHTVPNGNPPAPFAKNTKMSGVILLPPITTSTDFQELRIDDQKTIGFHAVVPLLEDEMNLKLARGAEALFDGFEQHQVTEILDPRRRSSIAREKRWFGFGR